MCEANNECHGGLVATPDGGLEGCLKCPAGLAFIQGMLGSRPPGLPPGWPQDGETWALLSDELKEQFINKAERYNGRL